MIAADRGGMVIGKMKPPRIPSNDTSHHHSQRDDHQKDQGQ